MNIHVPEPARCLGVIESPARFAALTDAEIRLSLERPVWRQPGGPTVFDVVRPGESLCLVVSDQTRKTATDRVLPVLLRGLADRGCRPDDLFILVATGIHRHPRPDEMRAILGPGVYEALAGRLRFHDPDDDANLVVVGSTSRGRRVRVNRLAMEARRRILLGAATYHYHAGFGGGRKSLVPGLASRDTIAHNHSLTLDPEQDRFHPGVGIGRLDGNPVSEEMLEGAALCHPDIVVNTVLSPAGDLIGIFSGDLDAAHRAACRLVEQVCRVDIPQPADFVIAWADGAANWIQGHKALVNADRAVRDDGRIVLVAPCLEGLGNERFRYWVKRDDLAAVYRELRSGAEVNGQTALSTRIRGARAVLVTGMPAQDVLDLGMERAADTDAAVRRVIADLAARGRSHPVYYLMPDAMSVVPFTCR